MKKIAIGAAIAAFFTMVLVILKEVMKGRVTADNLDELKEGIKDEKKKNTAVIKENINKLKLQDKIIKKKEKEIMGMSMGEQAKLAKKMGLIK